MKRVDADKFLRIAIQKSDRLAFQIFECIEHKNGEYSYTYLIYNLDVNVGPEIAEILEGERAAFNQKLLMFTELEEKKIISNGDPADITLTLSKYLFQELYELYYYTE